MRRTCTAFIYGVILLCAQEGCAPDLHTPRAVLAAAAVAVERDDGRALFELLDCRSRWALQSISRSRHGSARLIRAEYPPALRARSLGELGDAVWAHDAADLFSMRCPSACRAQLGASLGAPIEKFVAGHEVLWRTTRGQVRLHRCENAEWGLVWNTQALHQERGRAARELVQIGRNAAIYRRRRQLASALGPDGGDGDRVSWHP